MLIFDNQIIFNFGGSFMKNRFETLSDSALIMEALSLILHQIKQFTIPEDVEAIESLRQSLAERIEEAERIAEDQVGIVKAYNE